MIDFFRLSPIKKITIIEYVLDFPQKEKLPVHAENVNLRISYLFCTKKMHDTICNRYVMEI